MLKQFIKLLEFAKFTDFSDPCRKNSIDVYRLDNFDFIPCLELSGNAKIITRFMAHIQEGSQGYKQGI